MDFSKFRIAREARTIEAMVRLYCHDQHGGKAELCQNCSELAAYAQARLEGCPFGEAKPTCAKCSVHCYKADRRAQVREVMRYAGPRMLLHHPADTCLHLLDGLRKTPRLSRKRSPQ